jgi:hypothetical protein
MPCYLKWQSFTHHIVPGSLLCLIITDYNSTARSTRCNYRVATEILCMGKCPHMGSSFRISCDRAILFWYTCLSHCLFECALEVVLCHICLREVLRQLLSCNKVVHQHIMLFHLENVLLTDLVDEGLDIDLIWCGFLEVYRHNDM